MSETKRHPPETHTLVANRDERVRLAWHELRPYCEAVLDEDVFHAPGEDAPWAARRLVYRLSLGLTLECDAAGIAIRRAVPPVVGSDDHECGISPTLLWSFTYPPEITSKNVSVYTHRAYVRAVEMNHTLVHEGEI